MPESLPPLIDAASLLALLASPADGDLLVVDCRFNLMQPDAGEAAWQAGHVPGALYAHLDRDLSGPKTGRNGRHPLPSLAAWAETLGRWGLTPATRVVACDDAGGMFAARLWWMLHWVGHTRVQVLDGGWPAWLAMGGTASTAPPTRASVPAPALHARADLLVDAATVLAALPHGDTPPPAGQGLCLVDARAADRFRGENETLDPVGGHIPGARNRFFQLNLSEGRFKSSAALREEFTALLAGHDPDTVVHQCGSGVTACHNILAQVHAGLPMPRLYAGSWSEWCADPARPVAR